MAIIKGPVNPASSGTTTFPDLKSVQVTAPNRHSVRPSLVLDFANGKTLDPRITFTRGSSATYYDGTTALAEQNLVTVNSSWGWSYNNTTYTAASALDGTNGAWLNTWTNGANHQIFFNNITPSGQYTISVFFKKSTTTYAYIHCYNYSTLGASFNLDTGNVVNTGLCTATMTSYGGGWYRCSITSSVFDGRYVEVQFGGATSDPGTGGGWSVGAAGSVYTWGLQIEQRGFMTAYAPTTTASVSNYIPVLKTVGANQPRFEVDPITRVSKGLLVEEQRTNNYTYSSDFSNAAWNKYQVTVIGNDAISPDGTASGSRLTATVVGSSVAYRSQALTAGTYTVSAYFKKGTANNAYFQIYDSLAATTGNRCEFNLTTGVAATTQGTAVCSMTNVGNGWWRCVATATYSADYTIITDIGMRNEAVGNYLWQWGAQLEAGTFATSYIPTTTSAVTRGQDIASITGSNFSSWYNGAASTLVGEGYSITGGSTVSANPALVSIDDGTVSNRFILRRNQQPTSNPSSQGGFTYRLATSGTSVQDSFPLATVQPMWNTNDVKHKTAFAISATSQEGAADGYLAGMTSTSYTSFIATKMSIGTGDSSAVWNGHISKIAYYPVRLSNSELQGLTAV